MLKITTVCGFVFIFLCSLTANAVVTFDWATIGNPGNEANLGGDGAVPYVYRISKYEVTNAQYTEFLNAVDSLATNSLDLYNPLMSDSSYGGINFDSAAASGFKYEVKSGRGENPVIFVSFFDAMRFTNWLENGQGSDGTESGVYTIGNGINEVRNPSATYFIPSEDEWLKAAYHKNDGVTGNYWYYPMSTDATPFSDQPPGSNAPTQSNTGNFWKDDGVPNGYDDGFAVTGLPDLILGMNYLTDVGAYAASPSPYGTFDQGGNVFEWTEAFSRAPNLRYLRGGSWFSADWNLLAWNFRFRSPGWEGANEGFRVASIPEPNTGVLGLLASVGMLLLRSTGRRLR